MASTLTVKDFEQGEFADSPVHQIPAHEPDHKFA
jgi:hypothetical protein